MRCDEAQLVHGLRLPAGEPVTVRPVCPRDAGILQASVRALSPESRYSRFFSPLRELPPTELDRVIHLDPPNQLGLIAETRTEGVIGEARYALSSDGLDCEFSLSVADGTHGRIRPGRRAARCANDPRGERLGAVANRGTVRGDRVRAGECGVKARKL
jgi:hypothetical protein